MFFQKDINPQETFSNQLKGEQDENTVNECTKTA